MATINITCNCGVTHEVSRTSEIPDWVISMGCNWCPRCDDYPTEEYEEWYNPKNEGDEPEPEPIPAGDNQLVMPFIFEEMEIPVFEVSKKSGNIF